MTTAEFFALLEEGNAPEVRSALRGDPGLANARAEDGASALQWLTYRGRHELVEALLEAGPHIDLATACTIGKIDAVSSESDLDALSADGFRPLALAVAFSHNDIARMLLERGANPSLRSTALGGVAPIHASVFGRNLEGLALLVDSGAEIDATQEGGFTALMGAAQNGDLAMVDYLLKKGADITPRDKDGKSAADWAKSDEIRSLVS